MSERNKKCLSFPVLGDQKGNMYKFMKLNTDGQVLLNDVAGGPCIGVLDTVDGDATGKVVPVAYEGVVRVLAGATVAVSASVASTNAGLATTATGAVYPQGTCIVGGDSGDLIEVLLTSQSQNNA
jgi:hypothetical protein